MTLKHIRRYVEMAMQGDETVDARLQMLLEQRERILEQMADLQHTLDVVEYKCWYYRTAKEAGSEADPQNMPDEELPEPLRAIRKELHSQ